MGERGIVCMRKQKIKSVLRVGFSKGGEVSAYSF